MVRYARWSSVFACICLMFAGDALCAPGPPLACAIRWDAWYTNGPNDPAHFTAAALSNPEWRARTPLHAAIDDKGRVAFRPSQETFDAEIRAAKQADLCWAYLAYGPDHKIDLDAPMMQGLRYHRSSAIGSKTFYALIVTAGTLGGTNNYLDAVSQVLMLMHDSNYQKVDVDGQRRPLLFFFYDKNEVRSAFEGILENLQGPFEHIRRRANEQGLGDPYIVVLAESGTQAETIRKSIGANAIARYEPGKRNGRAMTWADYAATFEVEWNSYAEATSADFVPTLSTGGDIRARCKTPPPWDVGRFPANGNCDNYVANPSIEELKVEFRNAVSWLQNHREKDPARLFLVYSWSECDESGNCLMPTYGDPDGTKIRAIRDAFSIGRQGSRSRSTN